MRLIVLSLLFHWALLLPHRRGRVLDVVLEVIEELGRKGIAGGCLLDDVKDYGKIIKGMGRLTV